VVVGADGFLFHCHEAVFDQLCSGDVPPDSQIAQWVTVLESQFSWCAAKQVTFVTLVIPERHVVQADKLPAEYAISPLRPVARLMNGLDPAMRAAVLYPEPALRSARSEAEVYYKTDEHLNLHGHYVCYRALLNHIRRPLTITPLPQDALSIRRVHVTGSLGMRLDAEPTEDREFWRHETRLGTKKIFRNRPGRGDVEVFEHENRKLPRAIIFGDSNSDELRYLLIPHFSRTVLVYHCHQFFYDLVRSEQPDLVLHIMAEARLGRPYADGAIALPNGDFLVHSGETLPKGSTLLAIDFGHGGESTAFTGEGWSYTEAAHTWMVGKESTVTLPPETSNLLASKFGRHWFSLDLYPLLCPSIGRNKQRLTISHGTGGRWTKIGEFEVCSLTKIEVPLPNFIFDDKETIFLRFEHPDCFSPADYGQADHRILSLSMQRMRIFTVA
jgi:hypothetical protein